VFHGLLGIGLQPGDSGLRTDIYHWVEKECETWSPAHERREDAKKALYTILFEKDQNDLQACIAAGKTTSEQQAGRVRKYVPEPTALLAKFDAWEATWLNVPSLKDGKLLFTDETMAMHQRNRNDIKDWLLSGEPFVTMHPIAY
jgi:hypothetical protein